MVFDYGREEKFPTQYAENRTAVTVDVLDTGFIVAAVILAISFFISVISASRRENINLYSRIAVTIALGAMIILGNFGQEWEVGHIQSNTSYKAGSGAIIDASVGVKIGLRSVNITLKSDVDPSGPLKHEMIDYNERFHWMWDQGRFGFGPYAGRIQREFREAQYRGAPLPILWVADYFVIDGEGFRHGRFYRTAGWYAHIAMWSAFPCWLLANIFFRSVIRYGGYCLGLAGLFQLIANLLWLVIRNPNPLEIPFENATIRTKFGATYWLTFISGIICTSLCIAIVVCEKCWTDQLHAYFGIDPLSATDDIYITRNDAPTGNGQSQRDDEIPLHDMVNTDVRRTVYVKVRRNTRIPVRSYIADQLVYTNLQEVQNQESQPIYDQLTKSPKPGSSGLQHKKPRRHH